jgi:hypothetical protein
MNCRDSGNILSLASYLRAAPFVEKFELHVSVICFFLSLDLFFVLHVCCTSIFRIVLSSRTCIFNCYLLSFFFSYHVFHMLLDSMGPEFMCAITPYFIFFLTMFFTCF